MAKRKYYPRVNQVFASRDALLDKLEESGWEFEGQSTAFSKAGHVMDFNLGVRDEKKDLWLMIRLEPYDDKDLDGHNKVKVTRVRRLRISDYCN